MLLHPIARLTDHTIALSTPIVSYAKLFDAPAPPLKDVKCEVWFPTFRDAYSRLATEFLTAVEYVHPAIGCTGHAN
ncbi:hypothetical protein CGERO_07635 [Corynebacterium gerontici]|uniref:Uncharacterized protein n=1 Tax=Corynebacterium gerontici TaxID=2079234 RepID=A0A3G6J1G7_9CORY|nr:hypothetical protein CGERO_07635 [Corynebacterium gerontici]